MKDIPHETTDDRQEAKDSPRPNSEAGLSHRGISSILGADAYSKNIPTKPAEAPHLNRGQMKAVEIKAARELKPQHKRTHRCTQNECLRAQVARSDRQKTMGQLVAESLNDYKHNFPVYDFITPQEVASVKSHMLSEKYTEAHLANYTHDLRVTPGRARPKRAFMQENRAHPSLPTP